MYNSGDAAEQVVRISLEGTEVALKLTGSAAKNIAAMLYAVWKNRDKNKTKGHQRLSAMLKSGKELKVFTVSEEHLKQFALEAKRSKGGARVPKLCGGKDGEIPSVRAYLREAKQNRRGYC